MSTQSLIQSPIVVAIDKADMYSALTLVDTFDPKLCRVKVGKELFTRCGTQIITELHKRDFEIFLDLKFHDIPNTTAQAVLAAADMGVWMVNVHASAGEAAMSLSKQRLLDGGYNTLLIAVTVLTSMNETTLQQIGVSGSLNKQVERLTTLAKNAGLDGVVCSAQEATRLKTLFGQGFKLITPGIRMADDNSDDQQRICTPRQALELGSDYLVIGRSITTADSPSEKMQRILDSLK